MLSLFLRGFGILPPPTIDVVDIVWCGVLNGLVVIIPVSLFNVPAILWIFVISNASSNVKSGKIVTILSDSRLFPEPGAPA